MTPYVVLCALLGGVNALSGLYDHKKRQVVHLRSFDKAKQATILQGIHAEEEKIRKEDHGPTRRGNAKASHEETVYRKAVEKYLKDSIMKAENLTDPDTMPKSRPQIRLKRYLDQRMQDVAEELFDIDQGTNRKLSERKDKYQVGMDYVAVNGSVVRPWENGGLKLSRNPFAGLEEHGASKVFANPMEEGNNGGYSPASHVHIIHSSDSPANDSAIAFLFANTPSEPANRSLNKKERQKREGIVHMGRSDPVNNGSDTHAYNYYLEDDRKPRKKDEALERKPGEKDEALDIKQLKSKVRYLEELIAANKEKLQEPPPTTGARRPTIDTRRRRGHDGHRMPWYNASKADIEAHGIKDSLAQYRQPAPADM